MTSRDPLLPDNSILTSAVFTGLAGAWAKMDSSPLLAKPFMSDLGGMLPDYSKILAPILTELQSTMASTAAMAYPKDELAGMQKMIVEASGVERLSNMFLDMHTETMRSFAPPADVLDGLFMNNQLQSFITAMTKSVTSSIDTSYMRDILATASTFRDGLADQDLDELTDNFFEKHPDLADTIEESPALYALSKSDRVLIIWFVRICVVMTAACVMLNIETEVPELQRTIDVLGIGGALAAGKKAGDITEKSLDKLPRE